jgi:hypothetical protein
MNRKNHLKPLGASMKKKQLRLSQKEVLSKLREKSLNWELKKLSKIKIF